MMSLRGTPIMNTLLVEYTLDQKQKEDLAKKFLDSLLDDPIYKKQEMVRKMREARKKYESSRESSV